MLTQGENLDMVVQSTLTETGQYTLRVQVEYRDHPSPQKGADAPDSSAASEPRSLRKFYRFKVGAPIEVTTEAKLVNGVAFVQVQLKNVTQVRSRSRSRSKIDDRR